MVLIPEHPTDNVAITWSDIYGRMVFNHLCPRSVLEKRVVVMETTTTPAAEESRHAREESKRAM